ncbi:iron chelate uptake ABC transporter family permease subunit [Microbacterium sp. 2FI]|uniref:iron chelate uptake ABC transporter family permease subunit n=1 Tax=Microbacterium sp. 2FI TaxID=2502193 RepID=UPI0020169CAE|nr:iron chelate uptake ABC transporter family permease subunit [Microbacterium sp. 2FI]
MIGAVVLALVALYLFTAVPGSLDYALKIRGRTVLAMLAVAVAIGASTVVFQTITDNRILTPGIMGFDALYILIQTTVVFVFGSFALATADPMLSWIVELIVMAGFAMLLFRWLFGGARRAGGAVRSIHLMLLVGIVFGVFFRSLSEWMQRMIDPAEFAVLQDAFFASFTRPDPQLLVFTLVIVGAAVTALVPLLPTLDVLALGEAPAIGLGIRHRRVVTALFGLVAVMVAASTALVGPTLFFGLIVANLAYAVAGSFRHRHTLPMAIALGLVCLVGGQLVLERVFALQTTLSVVIEFAGGILFLVLILRRSPR